LAMRWALNTCEALVYLHGLSHPIIHRDLKPLNMFLTWSLEVA
jgi:serine/threonine protein kinase